MLAQALEECVGMRELGLVGGIEPEALAPLLSLPSESPLLAVDTGAAAASAKAPMLPAAASTRLP